MADHLHRNAHARHIEQIEQLSQAHRREQPRPDASIRANEITEQDDQSTPACIRERTRPDAPDLRYVVQLESENAFLRDQINRKDHQIEQRDNQIEAMIERDRETNILIEQLQRRIPMLPQAERRPDEARPTPHTDISDEATAEG